MTLKDTGTPENATAYTRENEAGRGENVVIGDLCQSNKDVDLSERREGERQRQ